MIPRTLPALVHHRAAILAVAALLLAPTLPAQTSTPTDLNQLKTLAKEAKAKGLIDQQASLLCQAATHDPTHFQKHCDDARADATRLLGEFDGYLGTGKFEFSHRDYPGAVRDLSRITFGPHLLEAQRILQQAHTIEAAGGLDAMSATALRAARIAYDKGDFPAAVAAAQSVQTNELSPSAQQILHNVELYRDTMALADSLANSGNYKAAQEKYAFALQIKSNGPGDPAARLASMNAALTQQQQKAAAATAAVQPPAPPASAQPDPRTIRLLTRAAHEEKRNNLPAALAAYNAILAHSPADKAATEGKRRVETRIQHAPPSPAQPTPTAPDAAPTAGASSDLLASAVTAFYTAHFASAAEQLRSYLGTDTTHNQGAAHFYLAASLLSQVLLADPQTTSQTALKSDADQQFRLAAQAGYHPLPTLVSPRILDASKEAGVAQ